MRVQREGTRQNPIPPGCPRDLSIVTVSTRDVRTPYTTRTSTRPVYCHFYTCTIPGYQAQKDITVSLWLGYYVHKRYYFPRSSQQTLLPFPPSIEDLHADSSTCHRPPVLISPSLLVTDLAPLRLELTELSLVGVKVMEFREQEQRVQTLK